MEKSNQNFENLIFFSLSNETDRGSYSCGDTVRLGILHQRLESLEVQKPPQISKSSEPRASMVLGGGNFSTAYLQILKHMLKIQIIIAFSSAG